LSESAGQSHSTIQNKPNDSFSFLESMALIIGRYNVIYDDEVLVLLQEQLKFSLFEHLVIITPDGNAYDENGNQYMRVAKSAFRPPCWVTGQYQRSVRLETTAPESS